MDFSQFALPQGTDWWDVGFAVLAVLAGWLAAHFARKGVVALAARLPNRSPAFALIAGRVTYYIVLLLGVGVGLAFLGANVQPLLGVVIIVAVVVVLVLRGVADNFAAGVLIQTRQTVTPGDEVRLEGLDGTITGTVVELNSRSVILLTVDGRTVHVPNAKLLSEPLMNNSTHGALRSEAQVRVERMLPVEETFETLRAAAAAVPGVDPERVRVLATGISPDRITARLQFWHEPARAVPVTADVVRAVAAAFDEAGMRGSVTSDPGVPPLIPADPL